ncbi:hypothetical protein [Lysobacter sp. GCM10012299]|uniref:hypothetical protein n=1 Tax=Lysobacter sp. GCM10012299 TaxID=3317333 RepID=UPI00361C3F1B
MNKLTLAVSAALVFVGAPVHAQFKLPGMGAKPAAAEASATTTPQSGDVLVTSFLQSQEQVVAAQTTLARALGLDDQATRAQAEAKRLSSGQLDQEDGLKKHRQLSEALQVDLVATMEAQPALTAEARATFATGLVEYLKAVVGARDLLAQAKSYTASVGANPMALVGKGASVLWVGKQIPGYVTALATTSKALLDYAKRNNIETPANATAALDGL